MEPYGTEYRANFVNLDVYKFGAISHREVVGSNPVFVLDISYSENLVLHNYLGPLKHKKCKWYKKDFKNSDKQVNCNRVENILMDTGFEPTKIQATNI